ncbi:MAG: YcaO-like family protein [Microgenomates group bacterium]|jgi:ribosomal protein S12 methylthiotransferase accessory factor
MFNTLNEKDEPRVLVTLDNISKIYPKLSFIKELHKIKQYSDEPKYFQYVVRMEDDLKNTDGHTSNEKKAGGGSFLSEQLALLKCLGEAIERFSCSTYKNTDLVTSSAEKLEGSIDVTKIVGLTERQKKQNKMFNVTPKSVLRWKQGYSLGTGKKAYIPAQLIYHNYKFDSQENMFYLPISTGAAGGGSLTAALTRGIFEIVERDSFVIAYLNKIRFPKVSLDSVKDEYVQFLLEMLKRYRLAIHVIDITNDLKIPCFLSIIVNKTGIGPAVSTGLKCHLDPIEAITGSIEEAFNVRTWTRQNYEDNPKKEKKNMSGNISNTDQRGVYWYQKEMIHKLDFWLDQNEKTYNLSHVKLSQQKILSTTVQSLFKKGYEIYYADVTLPLLKRVGYKIVKVVIPGLQPFYMNEILPYLGGERLTEVPKKLPYQFSRTLNKVPHPFL